MSSRSSRDLRELKEKEAKESELEGGDQPEPLREVFCHPIFLWGLLVFGTFQLRSFLYIGIMEIELLKVSNGDHETGIAHLSCYHYSKSN